MGGRVAGFETAALVDGHVDQHRSWPHARQVGAGDQLGRGGAGDQHAADDEVGGRQSLGDEVVRRLAGLHRPAEQIVEFLEPRRRDIEQGDVGAMPKRHLRRMLAADAAAEDQHLGRHHSWSAAEQDAAAAGGLQQMIGADVDRHPPGHLTHRREQRQPSGAVGDRFIGDGGAARLHQPPGLRRIGREVQICEEDMARFQPGDLHRLRLLDLDDYVGRLEHRVGVRQDGRADIGEGLIGESDARAGPSFDEHLMAFVAEALNNARRRADAEFQSFYFLGHADAHGGGLSPVRLVFRNLAAALSCPRRRRETPSPARLGDGEHQHRDGGE